MNEFDQWLEAYKPHIIRLWNIFKRSIQTDLGLASNCEFTDFAHFVYQHSDGYVSSYL